MVLNAQPLFRQTLGRLFHLLPRPVKDQHGALDILLSRGRCDIERGKAWTARAVGWLFKFPPAGRDLPTLSPSSPGTAASSGIAISAAEASSRCWSRRGRTACR